VPAYEDFKAQPNRANAINASIYAWQVHDWLWHEQHRGEDTRSNPSYRKFERDLMDACPELAWIRDVADAGKHRGLGRPNAEVSRVRTGMRLIGGPLGSMPLGAAPLGSGILETTPLSITLTDGSVHDFAAVLLRVIDYWRTTHFV
jgi:hypothetical protein